MEHIKIDQQEDGSRLDRVLIRRLGNDRRVWILRLIRKANVRLNGKRAKPEQRVHTGDVIFLPASLRDGAKRPAVAKMNMPPLDILYEDDVLLIINKPVGWVVHAGSGYRAGLIEGLRQRWPELHLAHRLDRDTSGCLLCAKRLDVLRTLQAEFRAHEIKKTYLAWVDGHPQPTSGRMFSFLSKGMLRSGERMVHTDANGKGKKSSTDYQTIMQKNIAHKHCALLALMPHSGRTHQLRVQLAEFNHSLQNTNSNSNDSHAILGDNKYASREMLEDFAKHGVKNLTLHAWRLRFDHPVEGTDVDVTASWPETWPNFAV
ncbi:MAG: RluA family pseudouridine synthase [Mariprofundales bacterium]